MMTSFIFLTLFAIMRTKKHGVVEHTTSFFFRIIGTLQRHQMHERYVTNKCYLLTTYYRTVFVICNLSKRVLYIKVLILI